MVYSGHIKKLGVKRVKLAVPFKTLLGKEKQQQNIKKEKTDRQRKPLLEVCPSLLPSSCLSVWRR